MRRGDRLVATLTVLSFGPVATPVTALLTDPLTILVSDNDGPRSFTIAQDEIPTPLTSASSPTAIVERWPFDAHSVDLAVALRCRRSTARRVRSPRSSADPRTCPGGPSRPQEIAGTDELVVDGEPVTQMRITASAFRRHRRVRRSSSSRSWRSCRCSGLTVAIVAYRGIRKVEATLMSWMAAMLFATIPLRTFLPGSPPIGSWVDYLVVLWVVAGLVLGLVIYVLAWLRWGTRGERAAPDGSIAVAASVATASDAPGD